MYHLFFNYFNPFWFFLPYLFRLFFLVWWKIGFHTYLNLWSFFRRHLFFLWLFHIFKFIIILYNSNSFRSCNIFKFFSKFLIIKVTICLNLFNLLFYLFKPIENCIVLTIGFSQSTLNSCQTPFNIFISYLLILNSLLRTIFSFGFHLLIHI